MLTRKIKDPACHSQDLAQSNQCKKKKDKVAELQGKITADGHMFLPLSDSIYLGCGTWASLNLKWEVDVVLQVHCPRNSDPAHGHSRDVPGAGPVGSPSGRV